MRLSDGGAGNPVTFGQHPDNLGVRVLRNLAHQGFAIGFGHPVPGFDADTLIDALLEPTFFVGHLLDILDLLDACLYKLCIHDHPR